MIILFGCCILPNKNNLLTLIKEHQQAKQNFSVQDAYKLIYQGNFGIAHMLKNIDRAWEFLNQEMDTIDGSARETLIEQISATTNLVRINLRPFKNSESSIDTLFKVMKLSAEKTNEDKQSFLKQWQEFKLTVLQDKLKFDVQELELFDQKVTAEDYPAVHHSPEYREANNPAYRVVKENLFREYFPNLK